MTITLTNCTFENAPVTFTGYNGPREQRKLDKWLEWFFWCEETCPKEYELERPLIGEELPLPVFEDKADAVAFKMIFGGED